MVPRDDQDRIQPLDVLPDPGDHVAIVAGKPVVVATQALEVFSETGLPQRAELSDLSLIARQRADAVMLGKETVFSPRPIECIRFAAEMLAYETRRFEHSSGGNPQKQFKAHTMAR